MASSVVSRRLRPGRRAAVAGGQDPPDHRGQVGGEQHRGAEALLHLGGVPVVEQPVGDEVLVHRAEVEALLRRPPGPGHPTGRIDDERQGCGPVAAGRSGDPGTVSSPARIRGARARMAAVG